MDIRDLNPSYIGQRPDIERLVSPNAKTILDIGCSTGTLGAAIKARTGARVFGIELSQEMAHVASDRLDKVFVGDAAEIILQGKMQDFRFDTIIFADILEHLIDPWSVLRGAARYLENDGTIIASIPNVRHLDTIFNLVFKGNWPYRERGIHDQTHLRFFTKRNIMELFDSADLSIDTIKTNYRFIERGHRLNRFAKFLAIPGMRNFLAFQYLIRAQRCT
ncbi:MAG: class I SAM-dependent methyltransferase [Candidatus Aureabacteria bacterium]|nr:class I SAM-dependent methyltransferase [Candidatus Auribacterota bacterium]MCK5161460.1 class I SAM-dependent methyltransferase [Candidatus Auribacterota bacterium]